MKAYYGNIPFEVDEVRFQEIFDSESNGQRINNDVVFSDTAKVEFGRAGFRIFQCYANGRILTDSGKIEGHESGMAEVYKFHGKPS